MKKALDILTVILLAGAFVLAYYTGFVKTSPITGNPALETVPLAIISIAAAIVLFAVGCGSSASARTKSETMTKSFLGLLIVQAASVIGMATIMIFLLLKMFPLTNNAIRVLYIVFAMIGVLGYADAILYTDAVIESADEEDGEEEEDGDDEADYFEEDEEETEAE